MQRPMPADEEHGDERLVSVAERRKKQIANAAVALFSECGGRDGWRHAPSNVDAGQRMEEYRFDRMRLHDQRRLATSSSMTSVAPPPIVRILASRAMRSIGVPMMKPVPP